MPSWTTPKTWLATDSLGASDMNTYVRDNMGYLLSSRPMQCIKRDNGADYTTTSLVWVDIDGTNLVITLVLSGTNVQLGFTGVAAGANGIDLDFLVDGTRFASAGQDGLINNHSSSAFHNAMTALVTGLTPGSHTFKVQWKLQAAGTGTLYAGAGAGGTDFIPTFWAREV
jgi:hypothetical protein